ncbi:MAG: hypothetical protein WA581_17020 [Candidatus Acidiferrales bacterium]
MNDALEAQRERRPDVVWEAKLATPPKGIEEVFGRIPLVLAALSLFLKFKCSLSGTRLNYAK